MVAHDPGSGRAGATNEFINGDLGHQVGLGPAEFFGDRDGQEPGLMEVLYVLHWYPALTVGLSGPLRDTPSRLVGRPHQVFPGLDQIRSQGQGLFLFHHRRYSPDSSIKLPGQTA